MRYLLLLSLLLLSSACAVGSVATITTTSLPNGQVGLAYSARISATGGNTPYSWQTTLLPAGIVAWPSTDTKSLALSGTPTKAGTYSFSITVIGHWKHKNTVTYTITIAPVPVAHSVTLQCVPSASAGVVSYRFYRSTISGGYYALLGSSATCSFNDGSVAPGTTYYYVATAWNGTTESAWSQPQAIATIP